VQARIEKEYWEMKKLGLALTLFVVLVLAGPVQAEAPADDGRTIPAPPPVVYRVQDDGTLKRVETPRGKPVGAYYTPAPPSEIGLTVQPPAGDPSLISTSAELVEGVGASTETVDQVGTSSLSEGYYHHWAWYYVGDAYVQQVTYFYQDQSGSQLLYWTDWDHLRGPGFGVVYFTLRNLRDNWVCQDCTFWPQVWLHDGWKSHRETMNTYIDSQGHGTRMEERLSTFSTMWSDTLVHLYIGN
jgi:hypothetical protein